MGRLATVPVCTVAHTVVTAAVAHMGLGGWLQHINNNPLVGRIIMCLIGF
jgi:hypothetical protein